MLIQFWMMVSNEKKITVNKQKCFNIPLSFFFSACPQHPALIISWTHYNTCTFLLLRSALFFLFTQGPTERPHTAAARTFHCMAGHQRPSFSPSSSFSIELLTTNVQWNDPWVWLFSVLLPVKIWTDEEENSNDLNVHLVSFPVQIKDVYLL